MLQSHFEVTAVGVHRSKRHPVAEDHLQVDNVRRDLDTAVAGRHSGEAEDTVGPDLRHCLERHRAVAGRFEDEVDLTELLPDSQHRMVVRSEERRVGKEGRDWWGLWG